MPIQTPVLDWLLDRTDTHANEATDLFTAAEGNRLTICISTGSVCTVAYVLERSGRKGQLLRNALIDFLQLVTVVTATKRTFVEASKLQNITDLEDAFQYQTALEQPDVLYFVTGNIKDFRRLDTHRLPVVNPADMVLLLTNI